MSHIAFIVEIFRKRTNTVTRFLLVGVINTLTGLSLMFMLLNFLDWSYWLSTFIGNAIGATVSYLLNRNFTFHSQIDLKKGAPRFIIVILLCYILSFSISEFIAKWLSDMERINHLIHPDELAILIGSALYTVSNYIGQRLVVFRR